MDVKASKRERRQEQKRGEHIDLKTTIAQPRRRQRPLGSANTGIHDLPASTRKPHGLVGWALEIQSGRSLSVAGLEELLGCAASHRLPQYDAV